MRIYERVKEGEVESEVKYKKGTRKMKRIKAGVQFFVARWGGGHPHVLHSFPCLSLSLSLFSPSAFVSLMGLFILKSPPPPFPVICQKHLSSIIFKPTLSVSPLLAAFPFMSLNHPHCQNIFVSLCPQSLTGSLTPVSLFLSP